MHIVEVAGGLLVVFFSSAAFCISEIVLEKKIIAFPFLIAINWLPHSLSEQMSPAYERYLKPLLHNTLSKL